MVFIQIIWTPERVAGVSVSISNTADALLKDDVWKRSLDVVKSTLHGEREAPISAYPCDLRVLLPSASFCSRSLFFYL